MKYIIILLISLLPATDLSYIKLVNKSFSNCNQIIENNVFKSCYNYELKSATASLIEIKAEQVNTKISLKDRHSMKIKVYRNFTELNQKIGLILNMTEFTYNRTQAMITQKMFCS